MTGGVVRFRVLLNAHKFRKFSMERLLRGG